LRASRESHEGGEYLGQILVVLLDDGRQVRLEEEFGFRDYMGEQWTVPKGAIVDGASIPRPLWSLLGSPFTGKYRDASVIHDFYCDVRNRSWQTVHRVFYDGMRASGVGKIQAKLFYSAVYFAGPRWSETVKNNAAIASGKRESSVSDELHQAVRDAVSYRAFVRDGQLESASSAYSAVLDLVALESILERYDPSLRDLDQTLESARGSTSSGAVAFDVETSEMLQFDEGK